VVTRAHCQHLAVVALLVASSLRAQTTRTSIPAVDSSAAPSPPQNQWPQRAWISVGLGEGTWPKRSIAGVVSGWYSGGPIAIGGRLSRVGQMFGEERSDQAFLVGARTHGNHAFLLGALGVGRVASSVTCDGPCNGGLTRPSASTTTYSVEAHANLDVVGVGLTMFGALGRILLAADQQ
jgi:hypothetical protein